jgi:hypothetical protein
VDWNSVSLLVGGLGLGGIITTALQTWMQRKADARNKAFIEKRDCYLGLLETIKDSRLGPKQNVPVMVRYAYWKARAALVASPAVFRLAQRISDTQGGTRENNEAHGNLLTEMRKDLGIDTRGLD